MAREIGVIESSPDANQTDPRLRIVPELRVDDELFQTWHEAVERPVDLAPLKLAPNDTAESSMPFGFPSTRTAEPLNDRQNKTVGVLIRRQEPVGGAIEIAALSVGPRLFKITVRIFNRTAMTGAELADPEAVLLRTLASTHTILHVENGE